VAAASNCQAQPLKFDAKTLSHVQRKFFEATDQSPRLVAFINSKEYLTDVFTRLPGMLAKDASTLPPANWPKARSGKPERMAA
jgi:hypothetical protein